MPSKFHECGDINPPENRPDEPIEKRYQRRFNFHERKELRRRDVSKELALSYNERFGLESILKLVKMGCSPEEANKYVSKRYGDKLYCKSASIRRKEMALRFIAYNLRLLIYYYYAKVI